MTSIFNTSIVTTNRTNSKLIYLV